MKRDRQRERHKRNMRMETLTDEKNTTWRDNPYLMRTVAGGWEHYVEVNGHFWPHESTEAGTIARTELKRAFYGGTQSMISIFVGLPDKFGADDLAGAYAFEALRQEMERYAKDREAVEPPLPGSIAAEWQSFRRVALEEVGEGVQLKACRHAFYAAAAWTMVSAMDTGEDGVSEDEGAAYLQAMANETRDFYNDVLEGRA